MSRGIAIKTSARRPQNTLLKTIDGLVISKLVRLIPMLNAQFKYISPKKSIKPAHKNMLRFLMAQALSALNFAGRYLSIMARKLC